VTNSHKNLERDWAQLGVLFNCEPSRTTPDPERLLLETARQCSGNERLLPLISTWLVSYGLFIARHRLKRLVVEELEQDSQPALGLLIETAVELGATRDLLIISQVCRPLPHPRPLYINQQGHPLLEGVARRNASAISQRWGVWTPKVTLKADAIRPVRWLLRENPVLRERIVRKGDLRASILETLRLDVPSATAASESALARLSGATRTAVRKALAALELEGAVVVRKSPDNDRDHPVTLEKILRKAS
jgi:hypothetical protein